MPIIPKYKINSLAKNFDLKAKDVVDILTQHGIPGKTSMTTLENRELNVIFEHLTQKNQVDDIESYMYNKSIARTSSKVPEKLPENEVVENLERSDKLKMAGNTEVITEVKAETKTEINTENKRQTMVSEQNRQNKQREQRDQRGEQHKEKPRTQNTESAHKSNAQNPAPVRINNPAQRQQQTRQHGGYNQRPNNNISNNNNNNNQRPYQHQSGQQRRMQNFKPYQPRPAQPSTTPAQANQNSPQSSNTGRASQFNQTNQANQSGVQSRSSSPNNAASNNNTVARTAPAAGNKPVSRREFTPPTFNRDSSKSNKNDKQRPAFKVHQQNMQNQRKPGGKSTVDIISSSDVNIKLEAGVKSDTAKIVDTRTSTVDLSKYDEKLNKFVFPDSEKAFGNDRDTRNDRQRMKKNAQQKVTYDRSGRPIDKERIALEKLKKQQELEKAKKKQLSITLPEEIIVSDLAAKLRVTSAEVIKRLFMLGAKASVNEFVDYDTAALVAMEFGAKVEKEIIVTIEDRLFDESEDADEMLETRAPVVVVMGHVDHGKTSLLDAIKNTNVTAGEAGGITQHIGAYRVEVNDREITFLDTPGHAAFTAMRARGAQVTDIAILVVAGDDGIMPQTVEAINHAKAAGVSIIVAINKMDLPQADADKVMQELTVHDLVPEKWGGDIICVPVSAHTKEGLDELLEMILLTADMKELRANPSRLAKGIIIEAKLDKGKGPVATVLIQNGTLNVGDIVIAGTTVGRVRAMNDYTGAGIKSAGPSVPVEIIGLSETPNAGDAFRSVEDERMARELVEQRKSEEKEEQFKLSSNITLEDLFSQVESGVKELNLIVKADVQGSVEALKASLIKESTDEVKIKVIHSGVGGITESDVLLASASNAIIIGFNVRPDKTAIDAAERRVVDVRTYRIIYECIEEVNAAIKGMLAPKFKEVVLGHAQVRQTIRVPNVGTIAGSYVQDGRVARNSQIRVVRDGIVIFEDKIASLRRFKDDVREVAQGYECGIGLEKFNDIKELDILESFIMEQIAN